MQCPLGSLNHNLVSVIEQSPDWFNEHLIAAIKLVPSVDDVSRRKLKPLVFAVVITGRYAYKRDRADQVVAISCNEHVDEASVFKRSSECVE